MYQFRFFYLIKKKTFLDSNSRIVQEFVINGCNLSRNFFFCDWLKVYVCFFFNRKKGGGSLKNGIKETEFKIQTHKKKRSLEPPPPFLRGRGIPISFFCIVLATWPSGKAGDCKSFFPSSNPGVAWSTRELKYGILFCW